MESETTNGKLFCVNQQHASIHQPTQHIQNSGALWRQNAPVTDPKICVSAVSTFRNNFLSAMRGPRQAAELLNIELSKVRTTTEELNSSMRVAQV